METSKFPPKPGFLVSVSQQWRKYSFEARDIKDLRYSFEAQDIKDLRYSFEARDIKDLRYSFEILNGHC